MNHRYGSPVSRRVTAVALLALGLVSGGYFLIPADSLTAQSSLAKKSASLALLAPAKRRWKDCF